MTDNPQPGLILTHEVLAGADLAYLLREVWRGRGLDPAAWAGATLPDGRPVTPELVRTLEKILIRARLARHRPVRGAKAELLGTHRQALEALRTVL